jgi:quinol monooxygenase YgiN
MSFHCIVRFEPAPGKEEEFREELLQVAEPSRAETGCLNLKIFESLRDPRIFAIHSEWVDEAAFDLHAVQPHTRRFVAATEPLLIHPIKALRLAHIDG